MRAINADEVIKKLVSFKAPVEYSEMQTVNNDVIDECIDEIKSTPTLDVKPVVHSRWVKMHPNQSTGEADMFVCLKCKRPVFTSCQKSINELGYVFCPHCGSFMMKED